MLLLITALVADDGKFITITLSQHFKHLQSASTASLPRLLANDAYLNRYSSENSNILKLETIFGQEMDREKANEWPQK